jgi:hypothetical protein
MDDAVHLRHGYWRTAGTAQDALQPPDVFERWADDDIPVILDDEIQHITGSESQAISDRLRNHRLALAAHRGGRHGVITSPHSYQITHFLLIGKTIGAVRQGLPQEPPGMGVCEAIASPGLLRPLPRIAYGRHPLYE